MADSHFPASKNTIMVVDDDPELVNIVRIMLEEKVFKVRFAYDGPQLFAGLEEQKPDLIILDIMMPQMDGLDVLKRLKGNPGTVSIPVLLLTAKVLYGDILRGYNLGADHYITKPFTRAQLLDAINLIFTGDQRYSN